MQVPKHTVQSDRQISKTELCTQMRNSTLLLWQAQALPVPFDHSEYRKYQKVYCIKNTKYKAVLFTVNASTGSL